MSKIINILLLLATINVFFLVLAIILDWDVKYATVIFKPFFCIIFMLMACFVINLFKEDK